MRPDQCEEAKTPQTFIKPIKSPLRLERKKELKREVAPQWQNNKLTYISEWNFLMVLFVLNIIENIFIWLNCSNIVNWPYDNAIEIPSPFIINFQAKSQVRFLTLHLKLLTIRSLTQLRIFVLTQIRMEELPCFVLLLTAFNSHRGAIKSNGVVSITPQLWGGALFQEKRDNQRSNQMS